MFASPRLQVRHVVDVQKAVGAHVRCLVPGEVPLGDAGAMWEAFDRIERHAAAAKTLLAARVDESRAWARSGDRSAAEHLARKGGTSTGAARAGLETSRRLERLPATEAALRRGELSRAQAETIAAAAAVNPSSEADLLAAARTRGLGELRERARRAKAAGDPDPDATHRRLRRERRLRRFTDGEGAWNVQARGTADVGAVFNASLDPIIDELFRAARREGRSEPREAYAFDALIELARRVRGKRLDAAPASGVDGDGDRADDGLGDVVCRDGAEPYPSRTQDDDLGADAPRGGSSRRSQRATTRGAASNPTYMALLRVDVEALRRGVVEGDELCEIAGVGPVPARVARELLGDAVVKLVITRGVDVANVTHLGRGPTVAQRIALMWASPACSNDRCSNTLGIEHDHRRPWTEVFETATGNLDRLCRPCHRRKTHEGWSLVSGRGRRAFVAPDDPRHPRHARHRTDRPAGPRGLDTAPGATPATTSPEAQCSLFGAPPDPGSAEHPERRSPVRAGGP